MSLSTINPCVSCGACCALFRASFYWREADPLFNGSVPVELTERLGNYLLAMKGTSGKQPRCICLKGTIGEQVYCEIYPLRSSTCRDFRYAWQDGVASEPCDKARKAWNLSPLPQPRPVHPNQPDTPQAA